jgi:2-polyprenyl-3-methyl-5-hydroxy-6-metoxy-1,4-benzoquinol methylase
VRPDHTIESQRVFYEQYQRRLDDQLPVERLKKTARLEALSELAGDQPFQRCLVVGCGRGRELEVLNAQTVVAFDLSHSGVKIAHEAHPRGLFLQADGVHIPLKSKMFDIVVCSEVIEHVLDPAQLVAELSRVLDDSGHLLLTTPNWISWWGLARVLGEQLLRRPITSGEQPVDNWFTPGRLRRMLSSYFEIKVWRGVWHFPPTGIGQRRLPDRVIAPFFRLLRPVDRLIGRLLPGLGHIHAVRAVHRT